jgi:hypothetical protein
MPKALKKIVRRVLGDERADQFAARLRMGTIETSEVHEAMMEELMKMPELLVWDERQGRR